jgi:hypothetical protein
MVAERKSETARSDAETQNRAHSSLGRRIATYVLIGGVLYLIAVSYVSVVPQVFWPKLDALDPAVECTDGLYDLRGELLSRAGDHISNGGATGDPGALAWLARWDRRHMAIESRCSGGERDAWRALGGMRERLESTLRRFDGAEGALARDIDEILARHPRR